MINFRYINYFLISILSSGLTYYYYNTVTVSQLKDLKQQIDVLLKENQSLREDTNIDGDVQQVVSKLDDCLNILMKNIIELKMNNINNDLNEEIKNICNRIIDHLEKTNDDKTNDDKKNDDNKTTDDKTKDDKKNDGLLKSYDILIS
tara:strand:+ start:240 stop:680 length:441 start_codon:yes stop_codon:yes gene_type:complete